MGFIIALGGLASGCASRDRDDDAASRCERLRDHVIDLRLVSANNVDVEAHRGHLRQALGDDFVASCAQRLTREQVDCALAATDSQAAAACSQ